VSSSLVLFGACLSAELHEDFVSRSDPPEDFRYNAIFIGLAVGLTAIPFQAPRVAAGTSPSVGKSLDRFLDLVLHG
jgi:hypothetical protein